VLAVVRAVVVAAPVVADHVVAAVPVVGFEAVMLTPVVAGRIIAAVASQRDSWSGDRGHSHK
jgi:hypothetical protein